MYLQLSLPTLCFCLQNPRFFQQLVLLPLSLGYLALASDHPRPVLQFSQLPLQNFYRLILAILEEPLHSAMQLNFRVL